MTSPDPLLTLKQLCSEWTSSSFPLHSRAHKMQKSPFYVKREDELGFSISGSKLRKYASLLPVLKQSSLKIALVGSAYSNHILSLVQLLKQEALPYKLFLEKPKSIQPKGNFFFLSLLLSEKEITWLEKAPNPLDPGWIHLQEESAQESFFWVPIGGCMKESLVGAMTLALDILENEQQLGIAFDEIFVDAGTGLTASALILAWSYLKKSAPIRVVLLAGAKKDFLDQLSFFKTIAEDLLKESIILGTYELLQPCTAKSFGSCNAKVFEIIVETARDEGFFLDPLYTAKLYLTAKKEGKGKTALWIHSGGALSLSGFEQSLLDRSSFPRLRLDLLK